MFGHKKPISAALPEKACYTKYYEHDGMLRAYANRAMVLAMLFGVIALTSLGFAMYVRLQPVTVIRVERERRSDLGWRACEGAACWTLPVADKLGRGEQRDGSHERGRARSR